MQIQLDVSTWTQRQKNFTKSAVAYLLHQAGITKDSLSVQHQQGVVIIENPSSDPTPVITTTTVLNRIIENLQEVQIANEAAQVKYNDWIQAVESAGLFDVTLAQVDNAIDNITNLSSAKAFLRKLSRYVIGRIETGR